MADPTWDSETPPPENHLTPGTAFRAVLRGIPLGIVTFGCLALLMLVRCIEWPLFGARRPVTPYITRFVCRTAFLILGIRYHIEGTPMPHAGGEVANHSSWLDIFALNAPQSIYFVAKAEVAKWPGIGWLARATGTVFIERRSAAARVHLDIFKERLHLGHKLLFFPEGTSSDGLQVLPFKTTLFAAFLDEALREELWIQPVTLRYTAPAGEDARFYGWWGEMSFGTHLVSILGARRQGGVNVIFHDPVPLAGITDRKALAQELEQTVRGGLTENSG